MQRVLDATGLHWTRELDESVLTMRARLPSAPSGPQPPGHPSSTRVS
jgi:hypothetical protein